MKLEFGEYLPDLPEFQNPGALIAKNVLPGGSSYLPFPDMALYSSAIESRCMGADYGKDNAGNSYNFAATANKLYKLSSATWANVSKVGGYSTGTQERWFFSRYNEQFLATNFADPIQTFTMGTTTTFSDLSATAPRARYITALRNFIVAGNTFDAIDGNIPHRVRWSAIGNPSSWAVSPVTQADYNDLDSSKGFVQQVIGGEYGVIFQERAITRMSYVGSPVIFQFDEVESGRGLLAPGGAVKVGNFIAYLGLDGFYIFDGNQSVPIGENKINRTFFNDVDLSYIERISSCADLDKQIIYWAYPGSGNNSGVCNKLLMYNYSPNATKRWSYAEVETEVIYLSLSEGYTLDSLDSLSTSLDLLPFSLDSRTYKGDNFIFSAFNNAHRQVNFSGAPLTASIDTNEGQLIEGGRAFINLIRPMVEGSSANITISLGTRNNLNESITWGPSTSLNAIGEFPVSSNARYHRARVSISGGFNHATGVEILKFINAGYR